MKHLVEDFWLFVILALTLSCVVFDKPRRAFRQWRARMVLRRENFCIKHNRQKWYGDGCCECRDERKYRERLRLEASAMKRSARIAAAQKVLGLSQ